MKTAEVTRAKATVHAALPGQPSVQLPTPSAWAFFMDTYRKGGLKAINKGVNAVAVRQVRLFALSIEGGSTADKRSRLDRRRTGLQG